MIFSPSRPDIYGLINLLYIKADANLDSHITEDELADVFKGFDKNGIRDVHYSHSNLDNFQSTIRTIDTLAEFENFQSL